MFKLTYFQATNVIGFVSGLGKKTFTLDLEDYRDKNLLVIIGDNATGKSTFLSLIHPSHTPSDDRTKFIVPGKEGSLIRTYKGDDGSIVTTKCIYKPKNDNSGHTAKCFISMKRPGEKEEIELNPNGNVTSYTGLLYTIFGITKEYLNFASYSDAAASIVKMTNSERKNSVSMMIPNTHRFEVAYNTVNEKYKELRNMIRNVSQKILTLRDEDSLLADQRRVSKELDNAKADRDENMRKFSKAEGRVKELSHGEDINKMIQRYNDMVNEVAMQDSKLDEIARHLHSLYRTLGIEPKDNGIEFDGVNELSTTIARYERKITRSEATIQTASARIDEIRKEMFQLENEITSVQSVIFGLQTQDIHELERIRENYLEQLASLRYAKNKEAYEDMSYDEIIAFSRTVAMLDHAIQALYDEYGELVSQYYNAVDVDQSERDISDLVATIQTKSDCRDQIYRAMIEKEQYRRFQDVLDQRPKTCRDDSCPFIATALKWQHVAGEIADLKDEYNKIGIEIISDQETVQDLERRLALRRDSQQINNILQSNEPLLKKYLNTSIEEVVKSIRTGMWRQTLNVMVLKSTAVILSEKDLYNKITKQLLPQTEQAIEIAKAYGSSRDMAQSQLDKLNRSLEMLQEELQRRRMEQTISMDRKGVYEQKLHMWRNVQILLEEFKKIGQERIQIQDTAGKKKQEIETIVTLVEKCREYDRKIRDAEDIITELTPVKQQLQIDLSTLLRLKDEKEQIELNFMIVDVIRSIAQPGKGIRKEQINLYMFNIYQTANQLLLNTFDGKLYLKPFQITDDEFVIPYVYNGADGSDIAYASSSQQSTIAMALSLAIMSELIDKYGVIGIDEADRALSAEKKSVFIEVLTKQLKYIGISQAFVISHSPEYYESAGDVAFIVFPGAKFNKKAVDYIEVG